MPGVQWGEGEFLQSHENYKRQNNLLAMSGGTLQHLSQSHDSAQKELVTCVGLLHVCSKTMVMDDGVGLNRNGLPGIWESKRKGTTESEMRHCCYHPLPWLRAPPPQFQHTSFPKSNGG